jgi:hypothetical protein
MYNKSIRFLFTSILVFLIPSTAFSQIQTLEVNRGFVTIIEIMERSCLMCHEWTATHNGLTDPVRYTPNKLDQSLRWTHVELLVTGETLYLANAVTGIAHSAIGLTIPIVVISSRIAVNRGFPSRSLRRE